MRDKIYSVKIANKRVRGKNKKRALKIFHKERARRGGKVKFFETRN